MKLIYSIHKCDVVMFTWLLNARLHTLMAHLSRYISKTGDGHLYALTGLFLYWSEGSSSLLLHTIALAFLIERSVYFVLKNSFKRHRPQAALPDFQSLVKPADQFSFPSGHTSAAFMMATLISYFIPALLVPLYGWAVLVGFSRVLLGVHFPTDTLMGFILGVGTALLSLEILLP